MTVTMSQHFRYMWMTRQNKIAWCSGERRLKVGRRRIVIGRKRTRSCVSICCCRYATAAPEASRSEDHHVVGQALIPRARLGCAAAQFAAVFASQVRDVADRSDQTIHGSRV